MYKPADDRKKSVVIKNKLFLFKALSILMPFVILFFLEIGLRIFNYGNDLSLFTEHPSKKEYFFLNPQASKRYFTNQKIATTGNVELFRKKKAGNTLRIFVLGESTTIGYPYLHNGSFHRWLQYRLNQTYPDRNFEIINLALTAVNSYTVLGFAKELVHYQPDAVFIYSGHNEYYGAMGIGATGSISGNPSVVNLVLALRELKITQLITNIYENTLGGLNQTNLAGESRMKFMVAKQHIPFQSVDYRRGVEQFRFNMERTLQILSNHHIPVFLSNLVSNDRDLKPFISFKVNRSRYPGFDQKLKIAITALHKKDTVRAFEYFNAAQQIYPKHALCNYYLGKLFLMRNETQKAAQYLSAARNLDGLRFRAPEEFNNILSELAGKYPGVTLVDTKSAFQAVSAQGVIGNNLILEHVHPNLRGYALLSDVFYRSMRNKKLIPAAGKSEMDLSQLQRKMPITRLDSLAGIYTIAKLKNSWPFNEALQTESFHIESVEENLAYSLAFRQIKWLDATDNIYTYYVNNRDLRQARKVIETLTLEYPTEAEFYEKAAMLSGELKDQEQTIYYFKRAFSLMPSFDKARYLFVNFLQYDRPSEAIPYINYAMSNNTSGFNLATVKQYAEKVIQLKKQYAKDSSDVSMLNNIAGIYLKMDNVQGASKYLKQVLQRDNRNREALIMLSQIKSRL